MRQDTEHNLPVLRGGAAGAQGGAEPALVAREGALGLPALMIQLAREVALHRSAVGRRGPAPAGVAPGEGNDGAADAQPVAAEPVIVLGVVGGVGQGGVEGEERGRLAYGGRELGRVSARVILELAGSG